MTDDRKGDAVYVNDISPSNGLASPFSGTDANTIFERENEYLAVQEVIVTIGSNPGANRFDRRLEEFIVDPDHNLDTACQIQFGFATFGRIKRCLDGSESLDVHDRQSKDLDIGQFALDGFKSIRRQNGKNHFHRSGSGSKLECGKCALTGPPIDFAPKQRRVRSETELRKLRAVGLTGQNIFAGLSIQQHIVKENKSDCKISRDFFIPNL